jgi:hypothetical protein
MEADALISFPNLQAVLEDFANKAKDKYKQQLVDKDKNASKKLYNSVSCMVEQNGTTYEVSLELEHYWKFIEEGIRPAGKYKNAGWKIYPFILEWIKVKPVIPRPMANGKLPSEKSLAYLITRSIKEHGIKPQPILHEATMDALKDFEKKIREALAEDCGMILQKMAISVLGVKEL